MSHDSSIESPDIETPKLSFSLNKSLQPSLPISPIFESRLISLEEARKQMHAQAGIEDSREIQAPCFVNMSDPLDMHLKIKSIYEDILNVPVRRKQKVKLRVIVVGASGSGQMELIETFSKFRFTFRKWKLEGGLRVKTCSLRCGEILKIVKLIEAPKVKVDYPNWESKLISLLTKGISESTKLKANGLKISEDGGNQSNKEVCFHILIYCMNKSSLSQIEIDGIKELEKLIMIIPVYCLQTPISSLESLALKIKFQNIWKKNSLIWFDEPQKEILNKLEDSPLGCPPPFVIITSDNFVIEKNSQYLATGKSKGIINILNSNVSDFCLFHDLMLNYFGPTAIKLAEKRVDLSFQTQSENSGIKRGVFAGITIGVVTTLAFIGIRGIK